MCIASSHLQITTWLLMTLKRTYVLHESFYFLSFYYWVEKDLIKFHLSLMMCSKAVYMLYEKEYVSYIRLWSKDIVCIAVEYPEVLNVVCYTVRSCCVTMWIIRGVRVHHVLNCKLLVNVKWSKLAVDIWIFSTLHSS